MPIAPLGIGKPYAAETGVFLVFKFYCLNRGRYNEGRRNNRLKYARVVRIYANGI